MCTPRLYAAQRPNAANARMANAAPGTGMGGGNLYSKPPQPEVMPLAPAGKPMQPEVMPLAPGAKPMQPPVMPLPDMVAKLSMGRGGGGEPGGRMPMVGSPGGAPRRNVSAMSMKRGF